MRRYLPKQYTSAEYANNVDSEPDVSSGQYYSTTDDSPEHTTYAFLPHETAVKDRGSRFDATSGGGGDGIIDDERAAFPPGASMSGAC